MEDEGWLARLSEACRAALDHARTGETERDRELIADLERFCADIERRLRDARARTGDAGVS